MTISAVVLTKDEENNIIECLNTLQWCDEVLVIDNKSSDHTVALAKKENAKVFTATFERDFSRLRNFALENATGQWVLFVDADERVPEKLKNEILDRLPDSTYEGYYLKRTDILWGKKLKYGEVGNIRLLRLARRDGGKWRGRVHEVWNIKGKTDTLSSSLLHYPHQTVEDFLRHVNYYTDLRAQELYEMKVKVHWYDIILYPKAKFFLNYIIRFGFLDGMPGIILAILMSFHSYLVRAKLWTLWNEK